MAVPLASGIAYALTAATTVQGGDSGELAAVGSSGGAAHPPGYPLFILWARLWSWLPADSPTHRVALATAMFGALAVLAVQRAARAWGASLLASQLAAALFAVSPLAWRLSSEPEVFMLNVAIVLTIVGIAAPAPWPNEGRRAVLLALFAGLGIANHHTSILAAPLGLFAWVRAMKSAEKRPLVALVSAGALLIGLSPYLYLLHPGGCRWGDIDSPSSLLHHFLRTEYGTTQLSSYEAKPEVLAQLRLLGESFAASGIALPLAGAALIAGLRRRWSWSFALLALTLIVTGPLFCTRFNLPPRHLMAHVVERFHLLPLALASVLGAFAIDAVLDRVANTRVIVVAAAVLALLVRGALTEQTVVANHRPTTERYLRNVTEMLPPSSILVASGDDVVGGLEYMQCTLGERPDVVVIAPPLLNAPWYAARVSRQLDLPVVHGVVPPGDTIPTLDSTALMKQLVHVKRPLFVNTWFVKNLDINFPNYPIGPLIRVEASRGAIPDPEHLYEVNVELYTKLALDDPPPTADTWAGSRYADYARTWNVLRQAFDAEGNHTLAADCKARADALTVIPVTE